MNNLPPADDLVANDFFGRAVQFQRAFGELPEPDFPPHDWPRYFMLCHAIELALKAYLAHKGATYGQLKGFGHDLTELLTNATQKGLSLTAPTHKTGFVIFVDVKIRPVVVHPTKSRFRKS
jgi:hypothetical protein